MNHCRGKLLQGTQLLIDPLNIYFQLHDVASGGSSGWYGYFLLPDTTSVEAGGEYRVVLEDGRAGDVRVENLSVDDSGKARATFVGAGNL